MLARAMHRTLKTPLILAAAVALVAVFAAGCGSKTSSSSSSQSPEAAFKAAMEKTSTITSGKSTLKGSMSVGSLPGSISISGGGPFDTKAEGGPALDLTLSVNIAGNDQKFGFVTVDGKSYMVFGDKAVEQKNSGSATADPGQIADFIKGLGENAADVQKTAENTYSATIDVKKILADAKKQSDSKLSDVQIPGLGNTDQLEKTLGDTKVTIKVDSEGYAQNMDINMSIKSDGSTGGLRMTIDLSEINQPQEISAPKNVVSGASELGGIGSALGGQ